LSSYVELTLINAVGLRRCRRVLGRQTSQRIINIDGAARAVPFLHPSPITIIGIVGRHTTNRECPLVIFAIVGIALRPRLLVDISRTVIRHRLDCVDFYDLSSAPQKAVNRTAREEAKKKVRGRIIFIRRNNNDGSVNGSGNQVVVDQKWSYRLMRCEVAIKGKEMRFYGLTRKAPEHQPLLREIANQLPVQYVEN